MKYPTPLKLGCIAISLTAAASGAEPEPYSGTCANGAPAHEAKYCSYFEHFDATPGGRQLDIRIRDALQISDSSATRAIGLVIAIDSYPNMPNGDLPAAKVDGDRLVRFLIESQKFDEVIVLRNKDASADNINYFLHKYLPNRATEFNKMARLLIAYSGHGRYGTSDGQTDAPAAFVLSAAKDPGASENMYRMQEFASAVEALASRYFHVLTLVNACYGGNFFTSGKPGGNPDTFVQRGSYALTAGSSDDFVLSLIPKRGSIFFDLIIEGVSTGEADPLYWEAYSVIGNDGEKVQQKGLTRTLALTTYLSSSYAKITRLNSRANPKFSLSAPWIGPAQHGTALGGFFFLSDRGKGGTMTAANAYGISSPPSKSDKFGTPDAMVTTTASPMDPPLSAEKSQNTEGIAVPLGPVSGVRGRPDIKIFKPPDIYPIKGFDLSSADGQIDWETFSRENFPRFIYARAVGWAGPDKTFKNRWSNVKALQIDRGAYLKFDFCLSPADQMKRITSIVPFEPDSLPFAIEIVHPKGESKRQLDCLTTTGMDGAKSDILDLASRIRAHYKKTPLLYGNRHNLATFLDDRSNGFMIWLGSYGAKGVKLSGRNPWTLWQYSGSLNIEGVGPKTTGEVFFGTEAQYSLFKDGQENVALRAID
ncbi:GH25 family lysozyme [Achromobacter insolitus]|uniref:GH25 family lysozyme n=1 Tax=Achromobacter insolitus TaxID=217204 RepID=UPI0009ED3FE2|nr:GH25 family lysozyme [Achromobacter insolitus]AVG40451.1 hypothetical protein MC81_14195 [Achromobacter insolitus]